MNIEQALQLWWQNTWTWCEQL